MHIRSLFLLAGNDLSLNEEKTQAQLDVQRVVRVPENLQYYFTQSTHHQSTDEYIAPLVEWLRRNALADDFVFVRANETVRKAVRNFCMMHGIDIAEEKDIFLTNSQAN